MPTSSISNGNEASPIAETTTENMSLGKVFKSLLRGLAMAFLINQVFKFFFQPKSNSITNFSDQRTPNHNANTASSGYLNAWGLDEKLDFYVYTSDSVQFSDFHDPEALIWQHSNFIFGDWNTFLEKDLMVEIPSSVQQNGSFYCHVFVTKHGQVLTSSLNYLDSSDVLYRRIALTKYLPVRPSSDKKNLLSSSITSSSKEESEVSVSVSPDSNSNDIIQNFWNSNLTIHLVADTSPLHPSQLTPLFQPHVDFLLDQKVYKPILFLNEFWSIQGALLPIQSKMTELPLHLKFYPISNFKFQVYLGLDHSFQLQSLPSNDIDEIKRMFVETHPGLLALTFFVTLLHSIFEFLAFKNDVQFWKGKKNLHGISVRSMMINLGIQLIIFLYLLDHQAQTSYVILLSHGIALVIEVWKLSQALTFQIQWPTFSWIPLLQFKEKASYAETKQYDEQAFRYLQYVIYPCLLGYSVYSLIYHEHKGWYSFIISTAVGFVYAFSFLQLTPQLFINYKLKSVAHMNARTLTYKFLTTILDDLYSFIIHMPTWHRIAVFRDDVVFVVFLIQRYCYRVDYSRPNEFGQVMISEGVSNPSASSTTSTTSTSLPSSSKKENDENKKESTPLTRNTKKKQ